MNTAEYLIEKLHELGITDFFGLPGDYNFEILKAVDNNKNTNWVGCTNELNAGYAADGYAREKGYGALITTYGVGELSAMNAIAGSFAENVPVIHIVGTPAIGILEKNQVIHHGFQNPKPYGYMEAFKNVVQTAAFLNKDGAKIEIDRVLRVFVKERKPVYIAIPSDIAVMEISDRKIDYDWISNSETLQIVIEKVTEKINQAQKPLILADVLIKRFGAKEEFLNFVQTSAIPVTNFLMGTGIVDSSYEYYLGTYLSNLENKQAGSYIDTTDCLIAVGTIYGDLNSIGTSIPYDIKSHIAIYGTYTYINGQKYENVKMSDVLSGIAKNIKQKKFNTENNWNGYETSSPDKVQLTSKYLYSRLQEFFKSGDIVFAETGTIPIGLAKLKLSDNVNMNMQLLWSSIGWATPAAFGACVAKPNARVILITGDGAHQITALEIANMCKLDVKPVIIVVNNKGYTTERYLCEDMEKQFNNIVPIDFSKLIRAFNGNLWSAKAETEDDFDKALRVTQIMDKLCYIEAMTDKADVPELFEGIMSKLKNQSSRIKNSIVKDNKESEIKTSLLNDNNYTTNVHVSIREYEKE